MLIVIIFSVYEVIYHSYILKSRAFMNNCRLKIIHVLNNVFLMLSDKLVKVNIN